MNLITVITPTYNRAKNLKALFHSLQMQTVNNFEWLIVDDGSVDDTADIVESMKQDAPFPVRYIRKENGGKHTALNVGIQQIQTPLTFIVDSDDTIFVNGMEIIEKYYNKYNRNMNLGFLSFLKRTEQNKIVVKMNEDEFVGNYVRDRIKGNVPGDMAEVFITKVLKQYPFPEFEGEKFLSEDVVWIQIGIDHDTIFVNEPIYECEYLADGLTSNDKKCKFASPRGSMMRGKMLMQAPCGFKVNVKGAIIYNCYKRKVRQVPDNLKIATFRERVLVLFTIPLGWIFYKKWSKF